MVRAPLRGSASVRSVLAHVGFVSSVPTFLPPLLLFLIAVLPGLVHLRSSSLSVDDGTRAVPYLYGDIYRRVPVTK